MESWRNKKEDKQSERGGPLPHIAKSNAAGDTSNSLSSNDKDNIFQMDKQDVLPEIDYSPASKFQSAPLAA